MDLSGKRALVIGAGRGGRGLGRAIAMGLARAGAVVAISGANEKNAAEAAAAIRETFGVDAFPFIADVTKSEEVTRLFEAVVGAIGGLDIMVYNAGITRDDLLIRMSEEAWDAVLDVNLKGAFLCSRLAAKIMIRQRSGRIVHITSVMGIVGNKGQANYAASKGGLISLTKSMAKELGSRGITVNAIAPGFVETAMTDGLPEEYRQDIQKMIPIGRLGRPEDIAGPVTFLCTDEAGYITGQVISVDGGLFT